MFLNYSPRMALTSAGHRVKQKKGLLLYWSFNSLAMSQIKRGRIVWQLSMNVIVILQHSLLLCPMKSLNPVKVPLIKETSFSYLSHTYAPLLWKPSDSSPKSMTKGVTQASLSVHWRTWAVPVVLSVSPSVNRKVQRQWQQPKQQECAVINKLTIF